jgi:hypothetical protein
VLDRRAERAEWRIAVLRKRASENDAKLRRLYDAIENGIADLADASGVDAPELTLASLRKGDIRPASERGIAGAALSSASHPSSLFAIRSRVAYVKLTFV